MPCVLLSSCCSFSLAQRHSSIRAKGCINDPLVIKDDLAAKFSKTSPFLDDFPIASWKNLLLARRFSTSAMAPASPPHLPSFKSFLLRLNLGGFSHGVPLLLGICWVFRRSWDVTSGNLWHSYWKWPFIVSFALKIVVFHSFWYVYQRATSDRLT